MRDSQLKEESWGVIKQIEAGVQLSQGALRHQCQTSPLLSFPTASKLNWVFLPADVFRPTYANIVKFQFPEERFN